MESGLASPGQWVSEESPFIYTSREYNGVATKVAIGDGKTESRDSGYVKHSECYVRNSKRTTVTIWNQLERAM